MFPAVWSAAAPEVSGATAIEATFGKGMTEIVICDGGTTGISGSGPGRGLGCSWGCVVTTRERLHGYRREAAVGKSDVGRLRAVAGVTRPVAQRRKRKGPYVIRLDCGSVRANLDEIGHNGDYGTAAYVRWLG